MLGVGIDENTAIVVERRGARFRVLGDGAVYVFDATTMSYTNLTEAETDRTLSLFHTRVHMLSQGDSFDLTTPTATAGSAMLAERSLDE
jgi:cyanophycinase